MDNKLDNPFSVETPEQMSAEEITELYVSVPKAEMLKNTKHIILHGHRGCGKSMMFRRMSPDCQMLINNCSFNQLEFFGVYLSIKKTGLDVAEYELLDNESVGVMFSEHALICHLASAFFREIRSNYDDVNSENIRSEIYSFINDYLFGALEISGCTEKLFPAVSENSTVAHMLDSLVFIFDRSFQAQNSYFKRKMASLVDSRVSYEGPLFGFHDFFVPMVERLKCFSFIPQGPVYFFIDDADNLNLLQTKVLNTWVSYRTYKIISLKISTQMRYKTYLTLSGERIENPHDYSEILVSDVYTGKNKGNNYHSWVKKIVNKRLNAYYGKKVSAANFFPVDKKQEDKIKLIAEEIKANFHKNGRGHRPNDDAYRYARPEYMTRISGSSKGGSNYVYAGFNQLIHISSGIIRLFLEPASKMFAEQQDKCGKGNVEFIEPAIQNEILRKESDYLLFSDFEKRLKIDDVNSSRSQALRDSMTKLRNLVITVGALFRNILLSDMSERRVFSFAISDYEKMPQELQSILDLGVQEGYLYESYIGSKERSGRTKLYVLNRRLAPYFKLDPMGFSGYKFVTCDFLLKASQMPKSLIYQMDSQGVDAIIAQNDQLSLL